MGRYLQCGESAVAGFFHIKKNKKKFVILR
jgi:hypothetical protein